MKNVLLTWEDVKLLYSSRGSCFQPPCKNLVKEALLERNDSETEGSPSSLPDDGGEELGTLFLWRYLGTLLHQQDPIQTYRTYRDPFPVFYPTVPEGFRSRPDRTQDRSSRCTSYGPTWSFYDLHSPSEDPVCPFSKDLYLRSLLECFHGYFLS